MKYFTLLALLFSLSIVAQTNFVDGSVTLKNNSKITGEINYQEWRKNPRTISFKVNDNVTNYKPEALIGFEVAGDKYISRKVTLDVTEQRLQEMDKTTQPKFEETHIFLNVLVEGNLNLYEYSNIRNHYFYGKNDEVKELIYRQSFSNDNGELFKLKQYIGQLNLLTGDCETIKVKNTLDYKRNDLSKLVSAYNNCTSTTDDQQNSYVKNIQKVKNRFYATAGYYFSNFKIDSDARQVEEFDNGSVSRFSVGGAYEIIISKDLGKSSLYTELTYSQISGELKNDVPYSLSNTYNPLIVDHSTLDVSFIFRYSFFTPEQKVIPFINLGLGRSQTLSEDIYVTRNNSFNGSRTDIPLETTSGYFNYVVGAGVRYNKFLAELRYIKSEKVINIDGSNSFSNLGIMIGYQLF